MTLTELLLLDSSDSHRSEVTSNIQPKLENVKETDLMADRRHFMLENEI